ncbi:MAG: alpha/beta hydrolase-fold protein [Anaerolineaceae bacterium]|nr:alpha/beta hydrolase-fold protein [Anaerolineaceae bacterium]
MKRLQNSLVIVFLFLISLSACVNPSIQKTTQLTSPLPVKTATETPEPVSTSTEKSPTQFIPSPTPDCRFIPGVVKQDSFDSLILEKKFTFSIYLPPCYDESSAIGFPVLYMLHGLGATDEQWIRIGLVEKMDKLIASGNIPPFMVVLPQEPNFYIPDKSDFDEVLIQELIPYVDGHYASKAERDFRAIGGLSRGAAWAIRLGVDHWALFSAIGAHSLPVFENDKLHILRQLNSISPEDWPDIFIDIGLSDPDLASAKSFEEALNDAVIPHTWYLFSGSHDETYWQNHLESYLLWYALQW